MKYPYDEFQPVRTPETVLAGIRSRAGRRKSLQAATLGLGILALGAGVLILLHKPAFPPPIQSLVVQKVWSGSKDVPYMVYRSETGHSIIFISSIKEDVP